MRSLNQKLRSLGYDNGTDYSLDGATDTVFISEWFHTDSQPTEAQLDALTDQQVDDGLSNENVKQSFELSKKDRVLIKWIASRTGGGTAQEIKAELRAIWDNIN
jgi:hypothetical protein